MPDDLRGLAPVEHVEPDRHGLGEDGVVPRNYAMGLLARWA